MVAGQFCARKLLAAIQTAVIIAAKQGAVAQGRAKALNHSALNGDDGLQFNAGAQAGESLGTPENRGQGLADAIQDIALGIGRDCLVYGDPAAWLARNIQSQDCMHDLPLIDLIRNYVKSE
jgi:hypothetical protein